MERRADNDNSRICLQWPTWFFRPDLPLGATLPTSHVANSSNVPTSSALTSRSHQDLQKGSEIYGNNKIHGQTPTICTVSRLKISIL
ncbi:hypothetical protein KPH14_003071 [Odynerus spinipes]|uniref:Uncharacterized protein n=1 Tax=Odynerus spinipes TaxID=1348599 RepID=A0AAD9RX27_9HYME|nr:hypothetical protein KPH14_003071 [Odynerus spinipes]